MVIKVLPVPVPGNFHFIVHNSEFASAADYCYDYSVRVAGHPKPIGRRLNYRECRYKPPRTSGGSLALPADSSPLWWAYTLCCAAGRPRRNRLEVSSIAEIARLAIRYHTVNA
jgi:hypothetical protein